MWDHEAEVVIIGYGGAGAAAAIVASDAGAKVLILEKHPEGGGNTKYSGGSIRTYLDLEKVVDFFETVCEGTTERDVVDAFVKESAQNREWLAGLDAETVLSQESGTENLPIINLTKTTDEERKHRRQPWTFHNASAGSTAPEQRAKIHNHLSPN